MGAAIVPAIISAVGSMAASALSSAISGGGERSRSATNQQTYRELAYPSKEAVEAASRSNRGELAQARASSYQDLASNLAARGFGAGSGIGTAGAANIERGYLQGLADAQNRLTQYANTPFFAPSNSVYEQATTSPGAAAASTGGNLMSSAAGMLAMRGLFGENNTPSASNPAFNQGAFNEMFNWGGY